MSLQGYLKNIDAHYDEAACMPWAIANTPGYHTKIKNGQRVHWTRESMDYALALLQSGEGGEPWRVDRAHDVIDKVLSLQQTDPTQQHYGIWGWFMEELPQQMDPADWNWADFIGARIAQMLSVHKEQLSPEIQSRLRIALGHAAMCIFRRNVQAGYTNIAIMGAVVITRAGELLDRPEWIAYGNQRFKNVLERARQTGGFNEYNSPTYTRVALEEVERCLMFAENAQMRTTAEELRKIAWRQISERFHPATGQMAGPSSRAYADWIPPQLAFYLSEATGTKIEPHFSTSQNGKEIFEQWHELVPMIPCPPEFVERFKKLSEDPHMIVTRFASNPRTDIIGTTWLTQNACLGTTNSGLGWIQQRALMGYWKTPEDSAIALRVQMLKNGHDMAGSYVKQTQKESRVLSTWKFLFGGGDHHPWFHRPPEDTFDVEDLRIRVSLQGIGVMAKPLDANRYELSAGEHKVVVHTADGIFENEVIHWECGKNDDASQVTTTYAGGRDFATLPPKMSHEIAYVDLVLYKGTKKAFNFSKVKTQIGYALELLKKDQAASTEKVQVEQIGEGRWKWIWRDLTIENTPESELITGELLF